MPLTNHPTTAVNLSELLEKLCESGVEFILVGGLAAVVQGSPLTTMDVDIVHKRSPDNINSLIRFLETAEAEYRRPDEKTIKPVASDLAGMGHILLKTRFGPLDILSFIEDGKTYEDLIDHTVPIPFRGHTLRVLDLKTLVELKRLSGDPRDQHRLAILEETLRQSEQDK